MNLVKEGSPMSQPEFVGMRASSSSEVPPEPPPRRTSSKYDFVKVRVWLGDNLDHYYVLSRFLVARVLTVTRIPHVVATKIALELKKLLVDHGLMDVSQADLEANLFKLMGRRGYGEEYVGRYRMMTRFIHHRIPLIVFIAGIPGIGKSTIATHLAQRLNLPNVLQTNVVYHLLRTLSDSPLNPQPVWLRDDVASNEERVVEFCSECRIVRRGLEGDINKALRDGKPIIIEGFHIDPGAPYPDSSAGAKSSRSSYSSSRSRQAGDGSAGFNAAEEPTWLGVAEESRGVNETEEPARLRAVEESSGVNAAEEPERLRAAEESSGVNAAEESSGVNAAEEPARLRATEESRGVNAAERVTGDRSSRSNNNPLATNKRSDNSTEGGSSKGGRRGQSAGAAAKARPIFVTVILRVDEHEHRLLLAEQMAGRSSNDTNEEHLEQQLHRLQLLQRYMCSFESSAVVVVDISSSNFPAVLDRLHVLLLERIEQAMADISEDEEETE